MWDQITIPWFGKIEILDNVEYWFMNWEKAIKVDWANKKGIKECWMKLPKLVCWHLWIERNHKIFQNKDHPPGKIVSKTQALMGEVIKVNQLTRNKVKLSANEVN